MRRFVAVQKGLIDEQTNEKGSGIFFLDLNDLNYSSLLQQIKDEEVIFCSLDEEGSPLREERGIFKKLFCFRHPDARFILIIKNTPFLKENFNYFLKTLITEDGIYEILSTSSSQCPEKTFSLLVMVKRDLS